MNVDTETLPSDRIIMKQEHSRWLNDSITKTGAKRLLKHEEELVAKIAAASMTMSVSTEYVRLLGAQLSTVKAVRNLLYDTETFVEKC
jgi:hypothetical protein